MACKFFEVENHNSNTLFAQGFTRLVLSHLPCTNYRLVDFGNGRKLEKIGDVLIDRPCPGASGPGQGSSEWEHSQLAFDSAKKDAWHYFRSFNPSGDGDLGVCEAGDVRLKLRPTPAGQIGIFPEHWAHWDWLRQHCDSSQHAQQRRVLHLFAYTGATTLFLASLGCHVTHVDASKPTVDWAKENARLSQLENKPIRWIVDDAALFVKRELRRNRQYDAIVLDPPTYGHGAQGKRWEIHRDLVPLLLDCWQLLSDRRATVLLCGHSSHIRLRDINAELLRAYPSPQVGECSVVQSYLADDIGRRLDCGFAARYSFATHPRHA
jgi:23S rRNA (cytosine1962-C5)-methyltransferase